MGIRIGIVKSEIWCKVWLFGRIEKPCKHLVYRAVMKFHVEVAERTGFEPTKHLHAYTLSRCGFLPYRLHL